MVSFSKFKHQFISSTVLVLLFLQVITISFLIIHENDQITESVNQEGMIPRLLSRGELELNSKTPSLITPAYNGPPSMEGNTELNTVTISSNSEFSSVAASNEWEGTGDQYDPYIISNAWETSQFGKKLMFNHLPHECTISIYTVAGDHVRTLEHNDNRGFEFWDMRTYNDQYIAYGMYVYVVSIPNGQKKVGKFLVIK